MHAAFEDHESGMIELRKLALNTLFYWRVTWSYSHESTFSDFLELCNSFSNQRGFFVYILCT